MFESILFSILQLCQDVLVTFTKSLTTPFARASRRLSRRRCHDSSGCQGLAHYYVGTALVRFAQFMQICHKYNHFHGTFHLEENNLLCSLVFHPKQLCPRIASSILSAKTRISPLLFGFELGQKTHNFGTGFYGVCMGLYG